MENNFILNNSGVLTINPSSKSTKNDFDFFVGEWKIKNKKLKDRLSNCNDWVEFEATQECHQVLRGIANTDDFLAEFDGVPFEGMTLRLFNPKTKLWSIYWADSNMGVLDKPVVGSFENNIGLFYAKDIFHDKEILVVFKWDKTDVNNPVWSQAFSEDNGKSWEWNWFMYMSRIR